MKTFFSFVFLLVCATVMAQTNNLNAAKVTIKDSFWLAGKWVKGVNTDPTLASPKNNEVPSVLAMKLYVDARAAGSASKDSVVTFIGLTTADNVTALRGSTSHANGGRMAITRGYATPGDGGPATYIWSSTSILVDDSSFVIKPAGVTGAGRWLLQLQNGSVSFKQLGAKADNTYPVTGTDNSWVWRKVMSNAAVTTLLLDGTGIYNYTGGAMSGTAFYMADTIKIIRKITVLGAGINSSIFYAPKGMKVQASECRLEGFALVGNYGQGSATYNSPSKHGMMVQSPTNAFYKVRVAGYSGDCWELVSATGYNCNNNVLTDCEGWYAGRHGLYAAGGDGNNIRVMGGDYSYNARWGVNAGSFLQIAFYSCHNATNAGIHGLNKSLIKKGTQYYWCIFDNKNYPPDSTGSASYWQPCTGGTYWTDWNRSDSFYTGGGYYVSEDNTKASFYDCYVEPDQLVWRGNDRSPIYGGELSIYAKSNVVRMYGGYLSSPRVRAFSQTGENSVALDADNGLMGWMSPTNDLFGFKGNSNYFYLSRANLDGGSVYFVSGGADATTNNNFFGNTAAPNGDLNTMVALKGLHLGVDGGAPANRLSYGTAAPTAGWHMAGEFVIYHGASTTIIGYRCTASGTPGTWTQVSVGGGGGASRNADSLGGFPAIYYANAASLNSYLPLSAGSSKPLTGDLSFTWGGRKIEHRFDADYYHLIDFNAASRAMIFDVGKSATDNGGFYSWRTSGVDRMFLLYDGKLGLGTNTPGEILHVVGNIRSTSLAGTGTRLAAATSAGNITTTSIDPTKILQHADTARDGSVATYYYLDSLKKSGVVTLTTMSDGGTYTIAAGVTKLYVNLNTGIDLKTIVLPPNDCEIYFGGTIAAAASVISNLTITAPSGWTVYGAAPPTNAVGGLVLAYSANNSNNKLYRKQ